MRDFEVVLVPCPEGGYSIFVPALKGCWSEGETEEEALANIKEAIKDYLAVLEETYSKDKLRVVSV